MSRPWSDAELRLLREHWPSVSRARAALLAAGHKRSTAAVRTQRDKITKFRKLDGETNGTSVDI